MYSLREKKASKKATPHIPKKDKNVLVQDYIKNLFRSGKISVDDAIPSERRLADLMKVSYLTARRGVEQLIYDRICYRVRRKTFIHSDASSVLEANHLNIILSYINPYTIELLELFKIEAKKINWEIQVTILHNSNDSRVTKILKSQTPTCIIGGIPDLDGTVGNELYQSRGWVVSVGAEIKGIPSVIGSGGDGTIRCLVYLISHGHRDIAYVTSNFHQDIGQATLSWKRCGLSNKIHDSSFILKTDPLSFSSEIEATYDVVKKALTNKKFRPTAFLCHNDYAAIGTRRACLEARLRVPEDSSIMCIGNTILTQWCIPQISSLDVNFQGHVQEALNYLKKKNIVIKLIRFDLK